LDKNGEKTIRTGEGIVAGNRPYKSEFWTSNGLFNCTYYISGIDFEEADNDEIMDLFVKDGLVEFMKPDHYFSIGEYRDDVGIIAQLTTIEVIIIA
jgi:hypothetical protein